MMTNSLKSFFAALSLLVFSNAADPHRNSDINQDQIKALEKLQPEVRSLGQSLSVFREHLKIPHQKNFNSGTELSYLATADTINNILKDALDYALDQTKAKILKEQHMVTGKPIEKGSKESAFDSLLEMLKLIRDIQDRLAESFGPDQRADSINLRRELDGAVMYDSLLQNQTLYSKEQLLALSFLRDKNRSVMSSSANQPEESYSSSKPSPPTKSKSDPATPRMSPSSDGRKRADTSLPIANSYAAPVALSQSPLFKKRANSTANPNKAN